MAEKSEKKPTVQPPTFHLIVTAPFGGHEKGERIADPTEIDKAMKEYADCVVKITASN